MLYAPFRDSVLQKAGLKTAPPTSTTNLPISPLCPSTWLLLGIRKRLLIFRVLNRGISYMLRPEDQLTEWVFHLDLVLDLRDRIWCWMDIGRDLERRPTPTMREIFLGVTNRWGTK